MKNLTENNTVTSRWVPLPLDFLLEKYNITSSKVVITLFLWILIIGGAITSVIWISPTKFMLLDSSQTSINQFFLFYPPLIMGTLLLFWVGFEWGFIPLFLSGFIITFTASVTFYWGLLFGIAFVLGLAIYALAYYCVPFDPGLRDFKSFTFFTVISFFAAIASSLGSFVWSDFFNLSPFETISLWKGWWAGMFLQSMLIVGPVLYLFTPKISNFRERVFPQAPEPKVTLGWIYSAIGSVVIVLMLFIIAAKVLGTESLHQQLLASKSAVGSGVTTNESLELISWISIGLVLSLGVGSIYLVGSWNKNLQEQVELKTQQLTESQRKLKEALNEQDLLLNVIHDRVRNNLSMVLALLELQLKGETDQARSALLKDSHARIHSMALIHETMAESESISEVKMKNFAFKLSNRLQKSFQNEQQDIEVSVNVGEIFMHIDRAAPVAMILNELMVNAFMHGFAGVEKGFIFVNLYQKENNIHLKVRNNGHSLPPDFDNIIQKKLGYKLIKTLVKQLQGEYKIVSHEEPTVEVIIPSEV